MSLTTNQLDALLRSIDRLKVAVQSFVTQSTQFVDDPQTITGTTMTLAHTPTFVFGVYYNGQRLTNVDDYSVSGTTVTFTFSLSADKVTVVYKY